MQIKQTENHKQEEKAASDKKYILWKTNLKFRSSKFKLLSVIVFIMI